MNENEVSEHRNLAIPLPCKVTAPVSFGALQVDPDAALPVKFKRRKAPRLLPKHTFRTILHIYSIHL